MRRELRRGVVRVEDFDNITARGSDRTAIADLAARFAVERCLRGKQLDLISLDRFVSPGTVPINGQHGGLCFEPIVADEMNGPVELDLGFHAGGFARFTSARALFLHQLLETGLVDGYGFTAQNIFG
jgi:hypothetical protein